MFEGSRARRAVRNLLWNTCLAQKFETMRPERRPALRGVINPRAASGTKTNVARHDGDGRMGANDGTHLSTPLRRLPRPRPGVVARDGGARRRRFDERGRRRRGRRRRAGAGARGGRWGGRRGTRGARRARRRACRPRRSTEWSRPASECAQNLCTRHSWRTPDPTRPFLNRVVDSPRHHSHAPRRCP